MGNANRYSKVVLGFILLAITASACCTVEIFERNIDEAKEYFKAADAARNENDFDQALKYYEESADHIAFARWCIPVTDGYTHLDPTPGFYSSARNNEGSCRYNQAHICYMLERHKECVDYSSQGLERWVQAGFEPIEPEDIAFLYAIRGISYAKLDKWDEAVEDYNNAKKIAPNMSEVSTLRNLIKFKKP